MQSRHKIFLLLMTAVVVIATPSVTASTRPVHAEHAIVVSVHELASKVGVEIMQAGGNAVDAAVATGFALAVVHPPAGNIGGGGFMLIRMADGKTHFLDYREKAPAAATRDLYLDAQGNVIPGASEIGYKAIGVPGSVAGMVYAEQKWGKLTLKQVMAPAIKLAREGYALNWDEARDLHDQYLAKFPESRRVFQRNGDYYKQGEIFRQPDLARTLERIAEKPDDFYHGALARELAAAMQKGGCLITADDLAHYEVKEREPVRGTYRGYEVISAPPPSSGGTVLIESLNILEGYDLGEARRPGRRSRSISRWKRFGGRSLIGRNLWAIPISRSFRWRSSSTRDMPQRGATRLIRYTPARARSYSAQRSSTNWNSTRPSTLPRMAGQ